MALETATYISDLNPAYPAATDPKSQGDDHLRLIKTVLQNSFPAVTGTVTPTHTELNYVDGVTSSIQTQLNARAQSSADFFTPTATAVANVTSCTVQGASYIRVGDIVQLSVYCTVTPTSAAAGGQFYLTLPVASDFTAVNDARGVLIGWDAAPFSGNVIADIAGNRLDCRFLSATTAAVVVCVIAQYAVY